jgi:hypothetical protein
MIDCRFSYRVLPANTLSGQIYGLEQNVCNRGNASWQGGKWLAYVYRDRKAGGLYKKSVSQCFKIMAM